MDNPQQPISGPGNFNIQIKADEKDMLGSYTNMAQITHRHDEFTVSFFYIFSQVPQGKLLATMVLSPSHAKRLMLALRENLERYENTFGPIADTPSDPNATFGMLQ